MNRSSIINAAAWVAVLTVVIGKLLLQGLAIAYDRVLPLIAILLTHAVLAWEDYQVGRDEYHSHPPTERDEHQSHHLTEDEPYGSVPWLSPIKRPTARGFK